MPDWLMFPSGPSPPITIATTADLVSLMSRRPPLSEITLLVTFGAKNVVEFQFLCRSDFTIGSSTYVVGDGQDERARARYESLVLGERLVTSERVMNEIFGEQEMLILHRVALEIGHADRVLRPQPSTGVTQGIEIIQLDDDDEMVDVSQTGGTGNGTLATTEGVIVPMEALPLAQIPAAEAPSVLWDVGLDLLDYPEFYNAQRDGGLVSQDAAFWNELIDDNYQSMEGLFLLPNTKETDVGVTLNQSLVGGGVSSDFGNKDVVALHETAGEYFGFQGLKFVCVCKTASCSHKGKVYPSAGHCVCVLHLKRNISGGPITPRIEGILTNNFEMTGGYEVVDIAEKEYEVRNKTGGSFHVNLTARTCSCFEFQMLAIPCSDVIAAALKAKMNVEELVIDEYKPDSLKRAYEGIILPESAAPVEVGMPSIVTDLQLGPPAIRRPPGRPKKQRYFSRGEKRVKCVRRRIKCGRCKGIGHNKATCKNPI
uniref:SWIM-type domain-containing protein n=1 Tax=Brassica campestris TaxID=3711 RepID=M4F017_BRACM